eukprot:NODE_1000_length_1331_cov_36.914197_g826_i0.p2 GENE.NODE_1000_length_1331_cov_36.914197_g826_i0~~NODE_1000_length_1331_cov_36.914197_g826_i0.p2  ORF type:complete len:150 (-),score=28.66 NODE_1000_length_1331_cov_36.914197_g826_i0:15-464(-)
MMIVDDEYIIIGSANINERSMAGDRDSEIAVGLHQPDHHTEDNHTASGDVAGFRLSLWAEHTGLYDPVFSNPHTLECVKRVNEIAEKNWTDYGRTDAFNPLPHGHLLKYPYHVMANGEVRTGLEFPDSQRLGAFIHGHPISNIPLLLTC